LLIGFLTARRIRRVHARPGISVELDSNLGLIADALPAPVKRE